VKLIYKAGGPFKTKDGQEYSTKNFDGKGKVPSGWNYDLKKALGKAKKKIEPDVEPANLADQAEVMV